MKKEKLNIDLYTSINNKLIEIELKYGNKKTIILVDLLLKNYFLHKLKLEGNFLNNYKPGNFYRNIPIEFVDNIPNRLIGIFNEYDKILILRNKGYIELIDKKEFKNLFLIKDIGIKKP